MEKNDYASSSKYNTECPLLEYANSRLEKLSVALPSRKELKGHLVDSAPGD